MRLILFSVVLAFTCVSLFSATIQLKNDSVFPLICEIYDAQGDLEGTVKLQSNQLYIWERNESAFRPNINRPYTPFSVRWICDIDRPFDYNQTSSKDKNKSQKTNKYEVEFGSWDQVSSGATVTAQGCPSGSKTCVIKKSNKKTKGSDYRNRNKKSGTGSESSGSGMFSNDGGQSWTNDGGPGWNSNDGGTSDEFPD